jgi:hypothetical protein
MRGVDRDPIREGHYGQRPCEPHSKAGHMAASTNAAAATILDNPEPSTHGFTAPSVAASGVIYRGSATER